MGRLLPLLLFVAACAGGFSLGDEREDFFETKIRPVLETTCSRCHGATKVSGALRIDSREALVVGGESGPAIVSGDPAASLLIKAVRRDDDVAPMPPEKSQALRADQVEDFARWIKDGAVWPSSAKPIIGARHWSFEPVSDPALPPVRNESWSETSIDRFILAAMESAGVTPAPPAEKLAWLRRVTFDLTGLPPTPEEVDEYLADPSKTADALVVERLLKSPAYGEKWGRHWLDVVRYADTAGETADYPAPLAWKYRDYVIAAFNADKPYDEFLREQIAGDILALEGPREQYAERVIATGFLAISRRFGFDSENYQHLTIQDTIDTLGQATMGIGLGCARCHDHKYDPITTADYYGLYGIFASTRYSFPGSEQKQRIRTLAPLSPPVESRAAWRAHRHEAAAWADQVAKSGMSAPNATLRSLHDLDGDFELQAPAAGGSNGVLVSPWHGEGAIAVTTAAQSPFSNVYPGGRVGASVAANAGRYRIAQAIYPPKNKADSPRVFLNVDFRVGAGGKIAHRIGIGSSRSGPLAEWRIVDDALSLRIGDNDQSLGALPSGQWINLQATIDLEEQTVSGRFGTPGGIVAFSPRPFAASFDGVIDQIALESDVGLSEGQASIEYDNLALESEPFPSVDEVVPRSNAPDVAALNARLTELVGIDGEFEIQTAERPPEHPWHSGPNSIVKIAARSQSPFSAGTLGVFMPNRGEYDGFGQTLVEPKPDDQGRLFVGFDFRCAEHDAGGDGSWRWYLGNGPGVSAVVELFFNAEEFFARSGDKRDVVAKLSSGQWHQVQLTLDLPKHRYEGQLISKERTVAFDGDFASGWSGKIDYTFIDSYGHRAGVRPALDADGFVFGAEPPQKRDETNAADRAREARDLRGRIEQARREAESARQRLEQALIDGPFPMAYAMAEGTPHDEPIQLRGEPQHRGEVAPRRAIAALGGAELPRGVRGSGRRELAEWIVSPKHPLTARVMVNRIWQRHFGRGIVATANDFGLRGAAPSHPALLDHLASEFVRGGWSIKRLHRLILLSATYRQAAPRDASDMQARTLVVGVPRRRLSAEEIRDSVLFVTGELDTSTAEGHPFPAPTSWGYSQHGPYGAVYDHNRRSVYLMTQRLKRHPYLALFDGADPNASTPERQGTTVPTQALFFLNDPFMHLKARRWAERLTNMQPDARSRIIAAWRQALGRAPSDEELADGDAFLKQWSGVESDQAIDGLAALLRTLLASNEFLHVE